MAQLWRIIFSKLVKRHFRNIRKCNRTNCTPPAWPYASSSSPTFSYKGSKLGSVAYTSLAGTLETEHSGRSLIRCARHDCHTDHGFSNNYYLYRVFKNKCIPCQYIQYKAYSQYKHIGGVLRLWSHENATSNLSQKTSANEIGSYSFINVDKAGVSNCRVEPSHWTTPGVASLPATLLIKEQHGNQFWISKRPGWAPLVKNIMGHVTV